VSSGQRRVEFNGSLRCGFRSRHGLVRRKNQNSRCRSRCRPSRCKPRRMPDRHRWHFASSEGLCGTRLRCSNWPRSIDRANSWRGRRRLRWGVLLRARCCWPVREPERFETTRSAMESSSVNVLSAATSKVCAHKGLASRTRRRRTETRMRLSAAWTLPSTTASTLRSRPLWMGSWSANRLTVAKGRTINCIFARSRDYGVG